MEFRVLGPLEVVGGDGKVALGGPKQRAVLAHLILRAGTLVPADRLIDEVWGEEPPETARNTLQTYVYRLRKLLGDGRIEAQGGGYVLRADPEEVDATRFGVLVRRAKQEAETDPARAAATLREALALWRGTTLSDLSEEPSLRGEIARLDELRLSATERRISAEIAAGGHSTVVSELEALTSRYPLRERMWASLMLALYRSGRQAEALSTFDRAREVLSEELGTEPSPELQRLHERILRRDPALEPPEAPSEPPRPAVRASRLDLQPGTEFAGYRILSTLGRGGMSVVYLAEHDWLQRKVALKVLAPQLAEDESFRERFIRESRLAASLDHPNVIPIFEAGASGADLYIAMRYVEGTDLRSRLHERGTLDPGQTLEVVRQVAAALDAAHEQGLVHRDVKPGNVLIARPRGSEAGEHVYLSDFGLTKRSASESGVTGTGQFVGTLDYAAPEQFKGGGSDARTDVYSLGCVLFECLVGHAPFVSENDAGLMYAHLQEPPPAATAERPELPRAIDAVVARAMAKPPAERYASAGAFVDGAARALGVGAGASAGATAGRSRLRRLVPAAAVVVALVAGLAASALFRDETPQALGQGPGSPTPEPSPTPAPNFRTVERPLSSEEQRLLTYVPEDLAGDCLPLDRDEAVHGELAALACRTTQVEVLYELFPTRGLMDDAFQINANVMQAPDGECATDTLAVGPYTVSGEPARRVLCYQLDRISAGSVAVPGKSSHIEWTDENASIYAHAVRNDPGDLSLYTWWLSSAGPVLPGADPGPGSTKDAPESIEEHPMPGGSYLLAPPRGCGGFEGDTCALRFDDGTYELTFLPFDESPETGTVTLQKPDRIVLDPKTGYCFLADVFGDELDPRPAVFEWSARGDSLSMQRTGGGTCAGPQKLGAGSWTQVPPGTIAVEQGGAIELIDPSGAIVGSTTQSLTSPNSWPDWSPDGERIVFAGAGPDGFDLYLMSADGEELGPLSDEAGDEIEPDWSPDGSRIAFTFDDGGEPSWRSGIAVVNADGSGWTEVIARDQERVGMPHWSPDGSRLAFTVFSSDGITPYVIDADGSDLVRLRDGPGVVLDWTPDGRRILLSADERYVSVHPDGSDERVFIEDVPEAGRLVMDWSPDGAWIITSSPTAGPTQSGPAEGRVYLMRVDGSQVFVIALGAEPSWRPGTG